MDVRAQITDGKVTPSVYASFKSALQALDGQVAHIIVEKAVAPRSLKQNAHWWAAAIELVRRAFRDQGVFLTKDQAAIFVKDEILKLDKIIVKGPDGKEYGIRQSSKDWSRENMRDYATAIEAWGAQWGYGDERMTN